ncbi:hypothetical protein [Bradyrhizobium sp. BR13661]|jgi:hypothetical protein|uniref:hypothetical protein n=1 Tax=Bradyrhizobium sp. BR13661 TaxID=2940622 RepID=UPI002476EBD3|nr:hypothetical protein [Bradyrhizobium sp. BR13661]
MFWVTQAGCAKAIEAKETTEISVPPRTDNEWVISAPDSDETCSLVLKQSMATSSRAVKPDERSAAIVAMLKTEDDRYSAHDVEFFEREAVAASARSI